MNYNANLKIEEDNPKDLKFNQYSEINFKSCKISDHVFISQG